MVAAGLPYWRLSSFYFFYFAFLGAWLPYWNLYLKSLGFSSHAIGVLSAIMLGTKIVGPSLWGYLADRSQRRMLVIRAGTLAATASFALMLFDQRFVLMALAILLYSFFWNAVLSQFEVVTLSHLEGHHTLYSRIRVWGSIGFIVAVGGCGVLLDHIDIQYLPPLLLLLLALIAISSYAVHEKPAHATMRPVDGIGKILRQPPVWAFLLSCFLMQLAHGPYYTFFSIYLDQHGYSRAATGVLWSLGVLAEVVLFLFMHRLMRRFSLRHILLVADRYRR
jgi:MFS transporter, PPP family, 3-phenylpropionic acid transporter